jgi:hypothetical protein
VRKISSTSTLSKEEEYIYVSSSSVYVDPVDNAHSFTEKDCSNLCRQVLI